MKLKVSEATLTREVLLAAQRNGWKTNHIHDSRSAHWNATTKGWPDIFAMRAERVLVAELKADGRYPSPDQREWLDRFRAFAQLIDDLASAAEWDDTQRRARLEVYVWKPVDLASGAIDAVLR